MLARYRRIRAEEEQILQNAYSRLQESPGKPMAWKKENESWLNPYSRFKADMAKMEEVNDWGGLGFAAVGLLRDLWVR